jgi:hypothetical protein
MKAAGGIWTRRAGLLAPAGVFLAANLAFFFYYGSTTRAREKSLEARRAALETEVGEREAEAARLSKQGERLSRASSAIEEFYGRRIGGRRETLAPVIEEIHTVLSRHGIKPAQIGYQMKGMPDLPLTQMLVNFTFRGDYATFKRLLRAFETNRRWIVVRDAALARLTDEPGSVDVRLTLATYFSGQVEPGREGIPPRPVPARARPS